MSGNGTAIEANMLATSALPLGDISLGEICKYQFATRLSAIDSE